MAVFPTLSVSPQFPIIEEREDMAIKSDMEGGYTLRRARHTRGRLTFTIVYVAMPQADKDILCDFIDEDVKVTSGNFDWTHPQSLVVYDVAFKEPPKMECFMPGRWKVELKMEMI